MPPEEVEMGNFQCSACGLQYSSSDNFAPCPYCMGLGRPNKKCTCPYCLSIGGQKMWRIGTNPDCTIHGINMGGEENVQSETKL